MFDLELQLKKILIKAPLLKPYVEWVEFMPTSRVNTGSTNGKIVFYNPENLAKRDESGQQFTLIHEILHIALNHMIRRGDREELGYNYACDAVINQMIKRFGIPIPEGSINCDEASGLSAEEYYDIIRSRPNYQELMDSLAPRPGEEETIAPHTAWNTEYLPEDRPKNVPTDEKKFAEENDKIKEKMAEDFFKGLAGQDMHEEQDIQLGAVGEATSFANWEDLLRYEMTKNKTDYDFFNGEFDEEGIWQYPYQPQKEEEGEVEILIDSSYSVDDELIRAFLREVKSIVGKAKIKIGCFNDGFDGFIEIKDETDIDNFTITSRGGTDFEVAVQSFQSPTATRIVFTDGGASNPKSFCEAIWIVYSQIKINPPGGFVYNVNPEKIRKTGRTK